MTLLYFDPVFLQHDTGRHPECAKRLATIWEELDESRVVERCERPAWQPISMERLARVHSAGYAKSVEHFCQAGGGYIEADTNCSPQSYDVALVAAGAVCDAVERVVRGEDRQALCLVRPPGHHALTKSAMGFCLFNNVALGARLATSELKLDRVLIIDWDVHHGNGTQDTFYDDEQTGFFSIHRWPFYPGTGRADETGSGKGLGHTRNIPVEFGTPRAKFIELFTAGLEQIAARIKPQLVILSAGFDAHRLDPVGSLGLESEDYAVLTRTVQQIAASHAGGRLVSVLEGGYHPPALAESVRIHLDELLAIEPVD